MQTSQITDIVFRAFGGVLEGIWAWPFSVKLFFVVLFIVTAVLGRPRKQKRVGFRCG